MFESKSGQFTTRLMTIETTTILKSKVFCNVGGHTIPLQPPAGFQGPALHSHLHTSFQLHWCTSKCQLKHPEEKPTNQTLAPFPTKISTYPNAVNQDHKPPLSQHSHQSHSLSFTNITKWGVLPPTPQHTHSSHFTGEFLRSAGQV